MSSHESFWKILCARPLSEICLQDLVAKSCVEMAKPLGKISARDLCKRSLCRDPIAFGCFWQDLFRRPPETSLYKISWQELCERPLHKISWQDLDEKSWHKTCKRDLCKISLGKIHAPNTVRKKITKLENNMPTTKSQLVSILETTFHLTVPLRFAVFEIHVSKTLRLPETSGP